MSVADPFWKASDFFNDNCSANCDFGSWEEVSTPMSAKYNMWIPLESHYIDCFYFPDYLSNLAVSLDTWFLVENEDFANNML